MNDHDDKPGKREKPSEAEPQLTPKQEVEKLMNLGIEFAELLLGKYGEFLPFGLSLDAEGTPRAITTYMGEGLPPKTKHLELLERGFREDALDNEIRASAIFYDVQLRRGDESRSDAVAVALEHRDDYSAAVYFAYIVHADGRVEFEEPEAESHSCRVFGELAPVIH